MGVNNRQRRAMKAKRRARGSGPTGRASAPSGGPSPSDVIRLMIRQVASSDGDQSAADAVTGLLERDPLLVDGIVEAELLLAVRLLWSSGWQPAELVRQARRHDAKAARIVLAAIAGDHVARPASTLHPQWAAQVRALDLPDVREQSGWLRAVGDRELLHRSVLLLDALIALRSLWAVGPVQQLIPPPGEGAAEVPGEDRVPVDEAILSKVRALLAQAESTTFEAEADAFTAKAQELMARHAIDAAVVWAASARRDRPISVRLLIDDPYANVKSLLLQRIAGHSRCRTVWFEDYSWSTVVGFPTDVAATELLFTSLLVQSQVALQAEAAKAGPGARARSRSFRSSFLMGFSHRIDERLAAITAAAEQDAADQSPGGTSTLLPALVARRDAVEEEVEQLFGALLTSTVRSGRDAAGWTRGTLAADLAHLTSGAIPDAAR